MSFPLNAGTRSRENRIAGLGAAQDGQEIMSIEQMNVEATLMDAHSRAKEVDQKRGDILMKDAQAQEDRKSKEHLALLTMAKDIMDKRADMQIQQSQHQDAMRMDMHKHETQRADEQERHRSELVAEQSRHESQLKADAEANRSGLKSKEMLAKTAAKARVGNAKPKP